MKKYFLLSIFVLTFFATPTFSLAPGNADAETVFNAIKGCSCKEVFIISGGVEKAYSRDWLTNIKMENTYVIFEKGSVKHYWNVESVVFIDWSGDVLRVYLEAKARL